MDYIDELDDGGISTHTLTWSVTSPVNFCIFTLVISTHTLTWSVTLSAKEQTLR